MRKLFYVLGAMTFTIVLVAGVGLGVVIYKGRGYDADSKAFVDSAIPAIAANWSKQQFLDRAAPELRARVKADELAALFDRFAQFGPLVSYEGATGQASMSYVAGAGGTVSASYTAKAHFKNGIATFRIGLLTRNGHWVIRDFYVSPEPDMQASRGA
jgi:hypothetical protein